MSRNKALLAGVAALSLATGTAQADDIAAECGRFDQQCMKKERSVTMPMPNLSSMSIDGLLKLRDEVEKALSRRKERLCFHETALLGFHLASSFYGPVTNTSQDMFDSYPQDIRAWLQQKGGIEKMPHGAGFWTMSASELWKMGYRKCEGTMP